MQDLQGYSIDVKSVEVEERDDGTGQIVFRYRGRAEEKTATADFRSDSLPDLFDCCQEIAQKVVMSEFRPNTGVNFKFNLVGEDGISIWHTTPDNYLKMPLQMNIDWTCQHLKTSYDSYTALGVIRIPDQMKLVSGRVPSQKLAELLMNSMVSGLEFIGQMFVQREQMGREHKV